MKRCPTCGRTYANDEFAFCLADGTLLSAPYNLGEARLIAPKLQNSELPITEALPPDAKLASKKDNDNDSLMKSSGKRRKWNETEFLQELSKNPNTQIADSVRELYEFSKKVANRVDFGSGSRRGSFNVKFKNVSATKSLYTVYTDGTLELNFSWLRGDEKSTAIAGDFGWYLTRMCSFTLPDDFQEKFITIKAEQWSREVRNFMIAVDMTMNYHKIVR